LKSDRFSPHWSGITPAKHIPPRGMETLKLNFVNSKNRLSFAGKYIYIETTIFLATPQFME
jgi:hypothetical protein